MKPKKEISSEQEEMRLNKYLAHSGICSRRKADEYIAEGEVKVNGKVVLEMGYKVKPTDKVTFKNAKVEIRKNLVYILLNKPKDYITSTSDERGRKTVMELIKTATTQRVYPVGRLDRKTTGLLLFTNDGELSQKLTHPSYEAKKIYYVCLNKPVEPEHLAEISKGITLEDGFAKPDLVDYVEGGNGTEIGIEIHIGKNRIVRRIFEHFGYDVVSLDRTYYSGLTKKNLSRGKWRYLTAKEVLMLKKGKKK